MNIYRLRAFKLTHIGKGTLISLALILFIGIPTYRYVMNPYRVMTQAFKHLDIDKLEWAIAHGLDMNASVDQVKPIVLAANKGMYNFMEILAAAGAELNLTTPKGVTFAGIIAQRNDSTALEILGRYGADFHQKADTLGRNVLTQIVAQGKSNLLPTALRYTNRNALDPNGKTALHYADVATVPIMEELVAAGENPNAPDAKGNTPMHTVSSEYAVKHLHRFGGEINGNNPCGVSPLFFQVANGNGRAYQYLLNNGANIDHLDDYGQSILTYAIMTEDEILYRQVATNYCEVFPDKCAETYKHIQNSGIAALATVAYTHTAHRAAMSYLKRGASKSLLRGGLARLGLRAVPLLGWGITLMELFKGADSYANQRRAEREAEERAEKLRQERIAAQHILREQFLTCSVVLPEKDDPADGITESSKQLTAD